MWKRAISTRREEIPFEDIGVKERQLQNFTQIPCEDATGVIWLRIASCVVYFEGNNEL
jgi:hypothetical protein